MTSKIPAERAVVTGRVRRLGRNVGGEFLVMIVTPDGGGGEQPWPEWAYSIALEAFRLDRMIAVVFAGPVFNSPIENVYVYDAATS